MDNVTSITLLARLKDRQSDAAWTRFFAIYAPLVEGWLRRRGIAPDLAEDVRQDVLVKVFQELPSFNHNGRNGAFRAWLRNVMAHRLRTIQRQRWRENNQKEAWVNLVDELGSDDSALTRAWNEEHDAHVVQRLLDLVAEEFQPTSLEAFRLVVIQGKEAVEVAANLGISVNAVRIAQSRVLAVLRRVGEGLID